MVQTPDCLVPCSPSTPSSVRKRPGRGWGWGGNGDISLFCLTRILSLCSNTSQCPSPTFVATPWPKRCLAQVTQEFLSPLPSVLFPHSSLETDLKHISDPCPRSLKTSNRLPAFRPKLSLNGLRDLVPYTCHVTLYPGSHPTGLFLLSKHTAHPLALYTCSSLL
jgi:hypothetical protein